jgi:hypothetical protein
MYLPLRIRIPMHGAGTETATRRRDLVADRPATAPLTTPTTSDQVAVIHVGTPPGGARCATASTYTPWCPAPRRISTPASGVSLANLDTGPAPLMVVAPPPELASRLAASPIA